VTKYNAKVSRPRIAINCETQFILNRAFVAADMPVTIKPNSFIISYSKRLDDLTLFALAGGWSWNVAVICPLAVSYISGYNPGVAAEPATSRKSENYINLPNSNFFQPIALENVGTLNTSAVALISSLARKIRTKSNDFHGSAFQPPPVPDASAENQLRWANLQSSWPCCLEQSSRLHSVWVKHQTFQETSQNLPVYIVILNLLFILLFVATWNVCRSIL